ncbi:hypothetical protein P3X46_015020 [Hevea brasiliensis]|uniref:Pectinesterase n=1 Tax=Hevea brasiliensis TaxID=3981 RepID=A0ABQ9LUK8_HEVBR|nr:hypothetical protein P3X46_015020 [Hevea brasiliensis]
MVSWNIDNHRRRAILEAKSIVQPHAGISTSGKVNLDDKLRKAEMHNVSITVNQNGTGDFKTIVKALKSIPPHNTRRFIIVIKPGVYREKIVIPRTLPFITFLGDSIDPPIIIGNDTASSVSGKDGMPLKTFQSATVGVDANHFIAINMKFENCHLNSIANKMASLTAQKRSNSSLESGFSFKDCVVTGSGLVYPGRAWGDYSRVVFSYTIVVKVVLPQGWSDWGDQKRDTKVLYGEYKCSGPGATFTGRVPWARILTDEEAMPFIETYYIDGDTWLITP